MVKIRLMRIGTKKRPFYRVVAVDERAKRTGGYIENLGTYNPLTEPKEIILKQDRIDDWIKKGAIMSTGFLRIIGKAPQRPPRKPKKQKEETPQAPAPAAETPAQAETPEAPAEETTQPSAEEKAEEPTSETPVSPETPAAVEEATQTEEPAPEQSEVKNEEQPEETK